MQKLRPALQPVTFCAWMSVKLSSARPRPVLGPSSPASGQCVRGALVLSLSLAQTWGKVKLKCVLAGGYLTAIFRPHSPPPHHRLPPRRGSACFQTDNSVIFPGAGMQRSASRPFSSGAASKFHGTVQSSGATCDPEKVHRWHETMKSAETNASYFGLRGVERVNPCQEALDVLHQWWMRLQHNSICQHGPKQALANYGPRVHMWPIKLLNAAHQT